MLKPKARDLGRTIYGPRTIYRWVCRGYGAYGTGLTLQCAYIDWRNKRKTLKGYGLAQARIKREAAEKRVRDREERRKRRREVAYQQPIEAQVSAEDFERIQRLLENKAPWWKFW